MTGWQKVATVRFALLEWNPHGNFSPAVRSVTLNLANKFSQCTFSVAEHYDLFSGLRTSSVIKEELNSLSVMVTMASIVWRHRTAPNRQKNCCRKSSTYATYHTDLKLIYIMLLCRTQRVGNSESTATSNPSGSTPSNDSVSWRVATLWKLVHWDHNRRSSSYHHQY